MDEVVKPFLEEMYNICLGPETAICLINGNGYQLDDKITKF